MAVATAAVPGAGDPAGSDRIGEHSGKADGRRGPSDRNVEAWHVTRTRCCFLSRRVRRPDDPNRDSVRGILRRVIGQPESNCGSPAVNNQAITTGRRQPWRQLGAGRKRVAVLADCAGTCVSARVPGGGGMRGGGPTGVMSGAGVSPLPSAGRIRESAVQWRHSVARAQRCRACGIGHTLTDGIGLSIYFNAGSCSCRRAWWRPDSDRHGAPVSRMLITINAIINLSSA